MFNKILKDIVEEAENGLGAVLMGFDGIAIDQFFCLDDHSDLQALTVECANVLKEIRKAAEILKTGKMEEVTVRTEKLQVLMRALTPEYFVALALDAGGNFGKGRYLLRRETQPLREALI